MLTESDRATLPVIATVFDKLNQEYKKYLDAEQSYTMVSCMYTRGRSTPPHPRYIVSVTKQDSHRMIPLRFALYQGAGWMFTGSINLKSPRVP